MNWLHVLIRSMESFNRFLSENFNALTKITISKPKGCLNKTKKKLNIKKNQGYIHVLKKWICILTQLYQLSSRRCCTVGRWFGNEVFSGKENVHCVLGKILNFACFQRCFIPLSKRPQCVCFYQWRRVSLFVLEKINKNCTFESK